MKSPLKYVTIPNPFRDQETARYDYLGQLVLNGTLDLDGLCEVIARGRPNIDAKLVRLVAEMLFEVIISAIRDDNMRCTIGGISFGSAISGSFPSVNSPFSEENGLYVGITVADPIRSEVAALEPTRDSAEAVAVKIHNVEDAATHEVGVVHGTATAIVTGKNISATLEGESVVLADYETFDTVSVGTVVAQDGMGQRLDVNFAPPFDAGKYWLVLRTRGYATPENEPGTYRKQVTATEAVVPTVITAMNQTGRTGNHVKMATASPCDIVGTGLLLNVAGGDKVLIEQYADDDTSLRDEGDCTGKVTANTATKISLSGFDWEARITEGEWCDQYPHTKLVIVKKGVRYVFPFTFDLE